MNQNLINSAQGLIRDYDALLSKKENLESTILATNKQLVKINEEKELLEKATLAIHQAKPLLSTSSIKQCEELANLLIKSVFELPYTIEFDYETQRFLLNKGDYKIDLAEAEGGGFITAISFVFDIYLLLKLGKRRLIFYDEHFTQISSKYYGAFISFVKSLCDELDISICIVSHDERLTEDMVDHVYQINDGISKKLK